MCSISCALCSANKQHNSCPELHIFFSLAITWSNVQFLFLQLYVDRPGQGRQTLVDPVYFPLLPGKCMCDSMKAVAEDMYWLNSSSCNTTDAECTGELLCNLEDSALQQVTMSISQCDNPPTLTLGMVVNGQSYPTELTDNTTSALGDLGVTVIYTVWYYNYSMDIQVCIYYIHIICMCVCEKKEEGCLNCVC